MTIQKEKYGEIDETISVYCFTLKNNHGVEIKILNFGGIITSVKTPDKTGNLKNITLGYDSLHQYIDDNSYFGAIIGRYGNRIAKGNFTLDNTNYSLAKNNSPNHLHGGTIGFNKVLWNAKQKTSKNFVSLELNYKSNDLEEGFPGNLNTTVLYTLTKDNSLEITYKAITDKKTVVNLTNHTYFNLSGNLNKTILDHEIQINANSILPVDEFMIPTGEIKNIENTPFDFKEFKTIAKDIDTNHKQIEIGQGFDHCWVLNNQNKGVRLIAKAYHKDSGRALEVFSDEPGVQFYTGNHLNGKYQARTGFCLETQHYPDSPNQKKFPSVILNPGETYISTTSYKFSVK